MTSDYDYDRFYIRDEVSSFVEVVIVIVTSHRHIVSCLLCKPNLLIYLSELFYFCYNVITAKVLIFSN